MRSVHARVILLVVAIALASACHEELGIGREGAELIEVDSLTLKGVNAVDESRLRSVLATKPSSWLPWGEERYFDRDEFHLDLQRLEAFYDDQGPGLQ